eukprot:snap_masked-scaffold1292_size50302-processed-gene-0.0 protein:Tk05683 transcript:snap_masked-scaffold1292_size50302-processed-gene-0.0-mRNA-1 annotation:"hypothetical protein DAPPUDRAFT_231919"
MEVEDVRPADNISINGERMEIYGPLVRASPMKYVVPKRLDVNYIRQGLQVYEDDLWIVTPPKCGTTWTQEIVWLLLNNVDLNAAQINQFYRIPFLELASIRPEADQPYPDGKERNEDNLPLFKMHSLRYAEALPRPRVIKTHLPLCMLPEKLLTTCKVVFVARNVMDMAVSYYYHTKLLLPMDFPFEEFAQVYKEGGILQTPMIPMILEAWQQRDHPHMCFLTFENMKLDTMAAIRTLQKFLGVHLEEKKLEQLHAAVQFESLKKNTFVNKTKEFPNQDQANGKSFIRKGIIGDWKNHFSQDMRAEWAKWARDQLKASDYDMGDQNPPALVHAARKVFVLFVARNVMDMAVSYYYHTKLLLPMDFPFEELAQVLGSNGTEKFLGVVLDEEKLEQLHAAVQFESL